MYPLLQHLQQRTPVLCSTNAVFGSQDRAPSPNTQQAVQRLTLPKLLKQPVEQHVQESLPLQGKTESRTIKLADV